MNSSDRTPSPLWDRLGVGISGICTLHCLLLPVVVTMLPLWQAAEWMHDWVHPLFILVVLPIIWFAVKRSHFNRTITTLLLTGLLILVAGRVLGHLRFGWLFAAVLIVAGNLTMIAGHWRNYRHHQTCNNRNHNHHPLPEEKVEVSPAVARR